MIPSKENCKEAKARMQRLLNDSESRYNRNDANFVLLFLGVVEKRLLSEAKIKKQKDLEKATHHDMVRKPKPEEHYES